MLNTFYPTLGANGLWVFLLVTIAMGGAAAVATGRAIATTWRPFWQLGVYTLLLAAVVRFLQYALFQQPFLSPANFAVDAVILFALAVSGHRMARARQMTTQYPWAFEASGPIGWQQRPQQPGSYSGGRDDRSEQA